MICTLTWNGLSIDEWEARFRTLPRSNLLQSYSYARAYCKQQKLKARWGVIHIDGVEAGLVQMFESGFLGNLVHVMIVDRGPLWFEGFGGPIHLKLFYEEINRLFPPRLLRKRRFLPETEDGPAARKLLEGAGLKLHDGQIGYQTLWLDLSKPQDALLQALRPNWRGALKKAQGADVKCFWDRKGVTLGHILPLYAQDKAARGYGGASPTFLKHYVEILAPRDECLIGHAVLGERPLAFVVLVCHGRSATYFAGWTSPEGRDVAAHHFLLWEAIKMLQDRGIKDFELGGINDETEAEGLRKFKEGLGGRAVRYLPPCS